MITPYFSETGCNIFDLERDGLFEADGLDRFLCQKGGTESGEFVAGAGLIVENGVDKAVEHGFMTFIHDQRAGLFHDFGVAAAGNILHIFLHIASMELYQIS